MDEGLIQTLRDITSALIEQHRMLVSATADAAKAEGEPEVTVYGLQNAATHISSAITCLDTVVPYDEATDEEQQH